MGVNDVNGLLAVKPADAIGQAVVEEPAGGRQADVAGNLRIAHPFGIRARKRTPALTMKRRNSDDRRMQVVFGEVLDRLRDKRAIDGICCERKK